MWNRFLRWLRSAPIADPIDRRNAPVMQLLLLFYGLLLPVNWAWRLASGGEVNEARLLILALDMLVAALAFLSLWMIRNGRFRPAVVLFLAMQLISLEIVFARTGVLSQLIDPAPTMLTLVISGLVLGRRALWIVFGLLMAVFATGFASDLYRAAQQGIPASVALVNVPAVLISYTLITIVLDRLIKALRESLAESNQRGLELQREMAERERAQSQLIHAQKLEASGRLASGVAHDFNNILGVIQGFTAQRHRVRDMGSASEQVDALLDSLQGIEEAAARGSTVIRKLLTFSRSDVLNIQAFDPAVAVAELRPMLRQLFPSSVLLELPNDASGLRVRLDRSEFELMVLNIAANARDAMRDGGAFRVEVGSHGSGQATIRLSDTGIGMSRDVAARIFEPFFSTKVAAEGTGLGLSVVHDLVKALGGDIRVDSVPGQGTTFTIRFPEAAAA
ncbi:sensor histidine kinase [Lysobacter niastensis]|uniref:histidine kinase n=1 Tax=Lysobacter niastensis TaxID=380629 RepID=A0ABS0B471_9GAMM|nr:ATP-binding protein [Lysobacter niastensis]MBF6022578.1 sensor histidine kinase [Lysobacter niastensis]